jgi:hypothetical protein
MTKTIFQYDLTKLQRCHAILGSCDIAMGSSGHKDKRLSNRFPYKTAAPYRIGSKHGMGSVVNISQDGMLFTTKDALNVGEKINIDFQFRHGRYKMNLNGKIVRIDRNGVGVKFLWL